MKIFDQAISAGWDYEYGGLLYFIDCLGRPPEAYEHDMKLWWPHDETMIASLMIFRDTGDEKYLTWFERTMDYCKEHFPTRSSATGTAISAGTASPPCLPAKAAPSRAPSTCPACSSCATRCWTRSWPSRPEPRSAVRPV